MAELESIDGHGPDGSHSECRCSCSHRCHQLGRRCAGVGPGFPHRSAAAAAGLELHLPPHRNGFGAPTFVPSRCSARASSLPHMVQWNGTALQTTYVSELELQRGAGAGKGCRHRDTIDRHRGDHGAKTRRSGRNQHRFDAQDRQAAAPDAVSTQITPFRFMPVRSPSGRSLRLRPRAPGA